MHRNEACRDENYSLFYREGLATCDISSGFAKAARFQYFGEKMDHFGFSSLYAQDALLKPRFSSAAIFVDEDRASSAAAADAVDSGSDFED